MRIFKVKTTEGKLQRVKVPDEAILTPVKESYTTSYNGQQYQTAVFTTEISLNGALLAKMGGWQYFRDESVEIEEAQLVGDHVVWVSIDQDIQAV